METTRAKEEGWTILNLNVANYIFNISLYLTED